VTSEPAAPETVPVDASSARPLPEPATADVVAGLVLAVPGVVRLHPGRFGEIGTYLPGRRVAGVRVTDTVAEVHVVVAVDEPLQAVAQQVHAVVAAVVDVPVRVVVDDLAPAVP
jgi:hypothetical protein